MSLIKHWSDLLFFRGYKFDHINATITEATRRGVTVLPSERIRYRMFDLCAFDATKVVILGNEPEAKVGKPNGLAYSVNAGEIVPMATRNIFKELKSDLKCRLPKHGDLTPWAQQGVLLLNTCLTVEQGTPRSHAKLGWHLLTADALTRLSNEKYGLVFVLWGTELGEYAQYINRKKHTILKAGHPGAFTANRGFFGSRPFSTINSHLKTKIDWNLT